MRSDDLHEIALGLSLIVPVFGKLNLSDIVSYQTIGWLLLPLE